MGCAQSHNGSRRDSSYSRRNTLVVKPIVNVKGGDGIKLEDAIGTKIIFMFGGPGSGKGTVVNNLIEMYNFRFICGEDLILGKLMEKCLPKCPENGPGTSATHDLQKYMQEDSSQLTLNWVLELIEGEVLKYPGETILVDIVPNLKFLLRVPTFVKNCEKEMRLFEERHPVALAINLALDQDHLIQNINQTHACTKAPSSGQSDDKSSSDEMDTSRTQRRFNIYLNSVKEFLSYFERDRKLLMVDTSCGSVDAVWNSIRDYVADSEIAEPCKGLEQVILLKMGESDFTDIDHDRYPMLEISCKQIVDNHETAPPEKILKKIIMQLRLNAMEWKTFLVDVTNTSLCSEEQFKQTSKHQLMYIESEVGQLDFFMHKLRRKTQRKKSLARKQTQRFKSITTNENEAILFHERVETSLCQKIGLGFINAK